MEANKTETAAASEAQTVVFAKRCRNRACESVARTFTPYCGCKKDHLSTCNPANSTTYNTQKEAYCAYHYPWSDYFTCSWKRGLLCGECGFERYHDLECKLGGETGCGCTPSKWCTRPSDSTGYVITGFEGGKQVLMTDLLPQYFEKVGIYHSCATGYSGTPTVTSCAEPGLPYTLSGCTTTTTTTTTSCSQVTCGFRCLRNATVHSPTSLPNCWYHHNQEACNDLVGYENGKRLFPCSLARPSLMCRANSATPC